MILGIPAAAHREALLRETAGGGRVPTSNVGPTTWTRFHRDHTVTTRQCDWQRDDGYVCVRDIGHDGAHKPSRLAPVAGHPALILHDDADPEAGAMGLARLAWVAWGDRPRTATPWWSVGLLRGMGARVVLGGGDDLYDEWSHEDIPDLTDAVNAAHAVGIVGVHLGRLDRCVVLP